MDSKELMRIARDWPGKSKPDIHPALWHMLDVGAVAQALCSRRSPTGSAAQDQALSLLIALHDLGRCCHVKHGAVAHCDVWT